MTQKVTQYQGFRNCHIQKDENNSITRGVIFYKVSLSENPFIINALLEIEENVVGA